MQRKRSVSNLSRGELIGGSIFFVLYAAVLPFAAAPMFRIAELLLGVSLSSALEDALYYYILLVMTVIIFHGFLARTSSRLLDNLNDAVKTLGLGLVALYGLNELVFRLMRFVTGGRRPLFANLNDTAISTQISGRPYTTLFIVLLLIPFVEETLFRGLIFGGLREKSRGIAYLASCVLFALLHVWQFAAGWDPSCLLMAVQFLVPGLVLAWAYENSGTLWASVAIHAAANALSVWLTV